MANMPPPSLLSRQCEKTLFTFPDAASCEISDEFACPKPIIPSTAWVDEPSSPDCLDEHLSWSKTCKIHTCNQEINYSLKSSTPSQARVAQFTSKKPTYYIVTKPELTIIGVDSTE